MKGNTVYVPKPELTLFHDTVLCCEIIAAERFNRSKLRVKSVMLGNGKELSELTAQYEDAMITVSNRKVYNSIAELKRA